MHCVFESLAHSNLLETIWKSIVPIHLQLTWLQKKLYLQLIINAIKSKVGHLTTSQSEKQPLLTQHNSAAEWQHTRHQAKTWPPFQGKRKCTFIDQFMSNNEDGAISWKEIWRWCNAGKTILSHLQSKRQMLLYLVNWLEDDQCFHKSICECEKQLFSSEHCSYHLDKTKQALSINLNSLKKKTILYKQYPMLTSLYTHRYLCHQLQMWGPVTTPQSGMWGEEVGEAYSGSPGSHPWVRWRVHLRPLWVGWCLCS